VSFPAWLFAPADYAARSSPPVCRRRLDRWPGAVIRKTRPRQVLTRSRWRPFLDGRNLNAASGQEVPTRRDCAIRRVDPCLPTRGPSKRCARQNSIEKRNRHESSAWDYGRPRAYQMTKSVIGGVTPSCRILDAF
jgi:hypothetical protein